LHFAHIVWVKEIHDKMRAKIQIVIAFLIWCYIIYRALFISITQDEAHTYLLVKTNNWRQALGTTNTHWLNSFFIKIFLWFPGPDRLWKIRIFPILSWTIYAYSAIRLGSLFKNQWIGFVFFIVAVLNPFLIFYFSLGRGYAPACSFIMLSLWLASKLITVNEENPQKWAPVFAAAGFATLSNFTAVYFFIALTTVFFLQLLVNKKLPTIFYSSSRLFLVAIIGVPVVAFGALYLIRSMDNLWFPATKGVINSLFGSLIQTASYFDNDSISFYEGYHREGVLFLLKGEILKVYQLAGIVLAVFLGIAIFYCSYIFLKSKKWSLSFLTLFSCFIIGVLNIFFHLVFNTPYLFERTTLILYPPLALGSFCFVDSVITNSLWLKRITNVLLSLLVIVFGLNYYKSFSLISFSDWPVQTDTRECLDYLQHSRARMVGINEWHYSVFANYYSKAYPNKYTFRYRVISDEQQSVLLSQGLLSGLDYLFLAPPFNDSLLSKNWKLKLNFSVSGAQVLNNDSVNTSGNVFPLSHVAYTH
jgi:hypothetical protein